MADDEKEQAGRTNGTPEESASDAGHVPESEPQAGEARPPERPLNEVAPAEIATAEEGAGPNAVAPSAEPTEPAADGGNRLPQDDTSLAAAGASDDREPAPGIPVSPPATSLAEPPSEAPATPAQPPEPLAPEPEQEPDEPGPRTVLDQMRDWVAAWQGKQPLDLPALSHVRPGSLVVEGLLAGVEEYTMRPVPAARQGFSRMRVRAFRVAALRELIERRVAERLGLSLLFQTADRFVLAGTATVDWEESVHTLQRELDLWLFQHLQPAGLLQVHLAPALCSDHRLPAEAIAQHREQRLLQPLEGALRFGLRWNPRAFVQPAAAHVNRCAGCAAVAPVHLFGDEHLCDDCARDSELSQRLARYERAWVTGEGEADIGGPGNGLRFAAPSEGGSEIALDHRHWALLRAAPAENDTPLTVEEVAERSPGPHAQLGYLRLEVDGAHPAFQDAGGDPVRTVALAGALRDLFGDYLRSLLGGPFSAVTLASLNAHGAVLAGPWPDALDFALRFQRGFARLFGDSLHLSAALVVAPPSVAIRSAVLDTARLLAPIQSAGGHACSALGYALEWRRAPALVQEAKKLAAWIRQRTISSGWLARLARARVLQESDDPRWRSLLLVGTHDARIRYGPARAWAAQLANGADQAHWPSIGFLARYAALVSAPPRTEALAATLAGEPEQPVEAQT